MRRFREKKEISLFHSLRPLLVSTRSLFLTRVGISKEVRLGLMLLIDLFIVVITTLLEPILFFILVPKDQEMVSLTINMVLPAIQGVISLLLSMATIECKYLTRQASSCSNSGLMEMEMGSFPTLGV